MAPLTWRNVDAPSFAGVNQALQMGAQSLDGSFQALSKALGRFSDKQQQNQSGSILADIAKYSNIGDLNAALMGGVANPGAVTPEVFDRILNARSGSLNNENAQLTIADNRFDFGRKQNETALLDSQRNAMPGASAELAQVRIDMLNPDPEVQRAAQARLPALLGPGGIGSAAGLDVNDAFSIIGGNVDASNAGYANNTNAINFSNVVDGEILNNDSRSIAQRAASQASNPEAAIKAIQQDKTLTLEQQTGAINQITNNAGTFWRPSEQEIADRVLLGTITPAQTATSIMNDATSTGSPAPASLVANESGGNWNALNDEGYGGRLQFGADRLADAAKAGIIPAGITGADFSRMPPQQQLAVENWHFADIDRQAQANGLDKYYGQTINGVTINPQSIRSMAHIGGFDGAKKFIESGGQYNPKDSNGTSLRDYGIKHGGVGGPTIANAEVLPRSTNNGLVANSPVLGANSLLRAQSLSETAPEAVNDILNQALTPPTTLASNTSANNTPSVPEPVRSPLTNATSGESPVTTILAQAMGTPEVPSPTPAVATGAVPPVPQTSNSTMASDLSNESRVNEIFNQNAFTDSIIQKGINNSTPRADVINQLAEGSLKDMSKEAISRYISQITSENPGISDAMAGLALTNNLEWQDLRGDVAKSLFPNGTGFEGWFGGLNDQYGPAGPNGRTAARVNMEGVKNDLKPYTNIGSANGAQTQYQNSQTAAAKLPQLMELDNRIEMEFQLKLAQAEAAGLPTEPIIAEYQQKKALVTAQLEQIKASNATVNYLTPSQKQ